jgi:hypothetical protein
LVRKTNRWNTLASWFAHHFIAVVLLPVHPPPSPTNQFSNGEEYLSPQDNLGASPILTSLDECLAKRIAPRSGV